MNQQLVFGLDTYRSKLVSPKDWDPRLRMSPPSRLFSFILFSFFFLLHEEFQNKKKSRTTRGRRNPSHGRWQCQGFATTTRFDNHPDSFFGIPFSRVLKPKQKIPPSLVLIIFSIHVCLTRINEPVSFLTVLGNGADFN